MGKISIRAPGVLSNPRYGKNLPLADPASAAYAMYFHGSGYGSDPLADLSGNGRNLVMTGANAPAAKATILNSANYLTTPFTVAQAATRTGAVTLVCLAQVPANTNGCLMSAGPGRQNQHDIELLAPDAFPTRTFQWTGSSNVGPASVNSKDATRGVTYECSAGIFAPAYVQALRKKPGVATETTGSQSISPAVTIGSTDRALRIGGDYGTTTGDVSMAISAVYDAALTIAQIEAVFADLLNLRTAYGLA
ncbi:hypothetical protein [Sphingomonas abietis]|uniref:Uncharacterized protein n=1 Tax=Sphingomonas abietis TaxID=3012344 RepID=A0ABY7NMV0_9SPHN|nr:hypothetical protein [Sphingomonas abietis]WBO22310.1 hypothetical protein PBT88_19545 [Sphingomonas abietis]